MRIASLKVRGPFKGPSGYEHHVREFVAELHRQGVAVQLADLPEWGPARLPDALRDPWFESLTGPVEARTLLHFAMPHQVVPEGGRLNVNYTMFEATRIPRSWVDHSRDHDLILLPTESSLRAWVDSGVPERKLRLSPLGVNPLLFRPGVPPLDLRNGTGEPVARYRVRFLNASELGPRKNLLGLLRAWIRATSRDDDAVLILKLGAYAPGWLELFRLQLADLERKLGKGLASSAPVHFLYDLFPDADMPRLFAAATHYISMSHGEGWDQPMVEAAVSDLKLIAPNHSAYATYLDGSVAHLIPSREVPAVFEGGGSIGPLFEGASWWEPDEDEAVRLIRLAVDGSDDGKNSARDVIAERFTWEKATRRLIELLTELEDSQSRPGFWRLPRWSRPA